MVAISVDHRVSDGAETAQFMQALPKSIGTMWQGSWKILSEYWCKKEAVQNRTASFLQFIEDYGFPCPLPGLLGWP
jgi:hypothetical protein